MLSHVLPSSHTSSCFPATAGLHRSARPSQQRQVRPAPTFTPSPPSAAAHPPVPRIHFAVWLACELIPLRSSDSGGGGAFKLDTGGAAPMIAPTDRAEMASAPAIQLELEGGPKPPPGGWAQTVVDDANAVKITLSDCLACSGCVTSAETVLMSMQSGKNCPFPAPPPTLSLLFRPLSDGSPASPGN